jgi:hypothetical protein
MRFSPVSTTVLCAMTLAVACVSRGSGKDPQPIPENELPRFLGPVSSDQFTWRVTEGPDFEVYYGKANPPLDGSVGFYFGGFPQDMNPGQTTVKSRLGRFPIKWHRRVAADGSIEQEGIILIDSVMSLRAHVWANAPNETQLDNVLSVVGRLPTFASGAVPSRFQELHDLFAKEQRIRRLVWIGWSAAVLATAWLVDRMCRRRKFSIARRLLMFAGAIVVAIVVTIGGLLLSAALAARDNEFAGNFVIYWYHVANGFVLLTAAAAIAALAILFALGSLFIRQVRGAVRSKSMAPR